MNENFLKLTNTVYKVLEFFPESDPLKNRAKDRALAIMEHLILLDETKRLPAGRQGWLSFQKEKVKAQLLEDIDILLGYLWIAKSQGWLNSSNCLIIANEYEKLKKHIGPVIEVATKSSATESPAPKEGVQTINEPVLNNTPEITARQGPPSYEITARQGKILEFLSKNEKAQVMDLQTVLPDVTKRTIRRDIDELLQAGKIVRLGDFNQVFYQISKKEHSEDKSVGEELLSEQHLIS